MREFPYITVGRIAKEINREIELYYNQQNITVVDHLPKITRVTFYRLEKRLGFPVAAKTSGGWRKYSRIEAEEIKNRIREEFRLPDPSTIEQPVEETK